jgi:hypothetical protein
MMNRKDPVPRIMLFAIIGIIVIAGGIYFILQQNRLAAVQNNPNASDTTAFTKTSLSDTVSAAQALTIVGNVPEVKQWEKLFSGPHGTSLATGGTPVIALDAETSSTFTIHVYEDMPDHIATLGWYDVDKASGKVSKEAISD